MYVPIPFSGFSLFQPQPPLAALERPNEKAICENLFFRVEKWAYFSVISPAKSPEPASQALREAQLKGETAPASRYF
jgi:hypothetical protein